jgi:hypothetical protein
MDTNSTEPEDGLLKPISNGISEGKETVGGTSKT